MSAASPRVLPSHHPNSSRRSRRLEGAPLGRLVQDALSHLNDLAYLQTHPLARLPAGVLAGAARNAGTRLRDRLLRAVESLRPDARTSPNARAWRAFHLLTLRYVEGLDPGTVQTRLAIAKSAYYEEHRRALDAVADVVAAQAGSVDQPNGFKGTLPTPLTDLIGREGEIEAVATTVNAARLVTVVGPAGVGKTRLALAVAAKLRVSFESRVAFVEVADVREAGLVIPAVTRALGLEVAGAEAGTDSLRLVLRSPCLLVLDNLEHVSAAAPELANLLQACPRVRILATSRMPLGIRGEYQYELAPLELPEVADRRGSDRWLSPSEDELPAAMQLFAERARQVDRSFRLARENGWAVANLCVRLDGLPLAIELAAARVDILSPGQLLVRLNQRLSLPGAGPSDLPPRQRTMEAAVGWSYELLSNDERALLRCLGVLQGSWAPSAAAAVGGVSDADALELVTALARHSLIQRAPDPVPGEDEPRFRMLETIRDYALGQLEAKEGQQARSRHADFWAAQVASVVDERRRRGPGALPARGAFGEDPEWLELLAAEHGNLGAALEWAVEAGDTDRVRGILPGLENLWNDHRYLAEGRRLLAQGSATPWFERAPPELRARWSYWWGWVALDLGEFGEAEEQLNYALRLYEEEANEGAAIRTRTRLSTLARRTGDHVRAQALTERNLEVVRARGDARATCVQLTFLGMELLYAGDSSGARSVLEEAVGLARSPAAPEHLPLLTRLRGELAVVEGKFEEAASSYQEGLAAAQVGRGNQEHITSLLDHFGILAEALGRPLVALRVWSAVDATLEMTGLRRVPHTRLAVPLRVRELEAELGAEEIAAARAEGRVMPLDQAVGYALEEIASWHVGSSNRR